MEIGPLEYVVIGVHNQHIKRALITELNAIQASGMVSVVDLIFVAKAADGSVTLQEMNELIKEEPELYGDIAGNLMGLLTAQDIEQLTGPVPPESSALIILFEHTWVIGLTEAVRKGGGAVFTAGMVSHEALAQVSAELAAAEKEA
jgi:Family of unknown function (DUF6325)